MEMKTKILRRRRMILAILAIIVLVGIIVGAAIATGRCGGAIRLNQKDNILMKYFNLKDGIDLKFAHAVNSQAKLNKSLSDSAVMVIEADILMDPVRKIPIMAHPPATSSDLTFQEFLSQVLSHSSRKGIKLDFKQTGVIEPSMKILNAFQKSKSQAMPLVMPNADILAGPESPPAVPINASIFLELCLKYGQTDILSLGWTTIRARDPANPKGYTWQMVREMNDLLKNWKHPVTFPIRASLVGVSRDQLLWLLGSREDFSLNIWHSKYDNYDVKSMAFLRNRKYIRKVFYDLPDAKIEELKRLPVKRWF